MNNSSTMIPFKCKSVNNKNTRHANFRLSEFFRSTKTLKKQMPKRTCISMTQTAVCVTMLRDKFHLHEWCCDEANSSITYIRFDFDYLLNSHRGSSRPWRKIIFANRDEWSICNMHKCKINSHAPLPPNVIQRIYWARQTGNVIFIRFYNLHLEWHWREIAQLICELVQLTSRTRHTWFTP